MIHFDAYVIFWEMKIFAEKCIYFYWDKTSQRYWFLMRLALGFGVNLITMKGKSRYL